MKKTEKELEKLLEQKNKLIKDRKNWDKECKTYPWSEDDIYESSKRIKTYRKTMAELVQNFKEEPSNQAIKDKIDHLDSLLKEEQKKYAVLMEKLKRYQGFSGIKVAEAEAKHKKLEKQLAGQKKTNRPWIFLGIGFAVLTMISLVISAMLIPQMFPGYGWVGALLSIVFLSAAYAGVFYSGYKPVSENEEWIVEFLGEYITTWESGPHFQFPFLMRVVGEYFLGDTLLPLRMTDNKSAKVDFTDTSAEVKVSLYYRIFDSYAAMYGIDDVEKAIAEKMEAGIRAYYGGQSLDYAIATRAEVDLRKIIIQNATEAEKFKKWGVEIVSLAVTDIIVPTNIEKIRDTRIEADKALEVAKVQKEQAVVEAEKALIKGQEEGNKLKKKAETIGKTVEELLDYELKLKRYEAISKSSMLIVNEGNTDVSTPAIAGAAMGKGNQASSQSAVPKTTK